MDTAIITITYTDDDNFNITVDFSPPITGDDDEDNPAAGLACYLLNVLKEEGDITNIRLD